MRESSKFFQNIDLFRIENWWEINCLQQSNWNFSCIQHFWQLCKFSTCVATKLRRQVIKCWNCASSSSCFSSSFITKRLLCIVTSCFRPCLSVCMFVIVNAVMFVSLSVCPSVSMSVCPYGSHFDHPFYVDLGPYFLKTLICEAKSSYVFLAKILIRIQGHTSLIGSPNNDW